MVTVTCDVGNSTKHISTAEYGTWFYIPKLNAAGRLSDTKYPLFEQHGYYYFYVPLLDGREVSLTADEFEPINSQNDNHYRVGDMVRVSNYYLKDHPIFIRDEPDGYDGEFKLSCDDVGIIEEISPFHVVIRFADIDYRWNDHSTSICIGDDLHTDDSENWKGSSIVIAFPLQSDYYYHTLDEIRICDRCQCLVEEDDLRCTDEWSLTALKGNDAVQSICSYCYDQDDIVYRFTTHGDDECHDEYSHYIGEHSSNLDCGDIPDILNNFLDAWDFNYHNFKEENNSVTFLELCVVAGARHAFMFYVESKIKDYMKGACRNCYFSILECEGNFGHHIYIRRSELCAFAAWLNKLVKKNEIAKQTAIDILGIYQPTEKQIMESFKCGTEPEFEPVNKKVGVFSVFDLIQLGAEPGCSEIAKFRNTFGCNEAKFTIPNMIQALKAGLDVAWFTNRAIGGKPLDVGLSIECDNPCECMAKMLFDKYWTRVAGGTNISIYAWYNSVRYRIEVRGTNGKTLEVYSEHVGVPLLVNTMEKRVNGILDLWAQRARGEGFNVVNIASFGVDTVKDG